MRTQTVLLAAFLGLAAVSPSISVAQTTRYLDEAGNVHFVDSPSQVPERYRVQLAKPTQPPATEKQYKQELKEWKKKKKDEEREKKKREKEKAKERKRMEKEMAKRDKARSGKQSSSSAKESTRFNSEANATPAPIVR